MAPAKKRNPLEELSKTNGFKVVIKKAKAAPKTSIKKALKFQLVICLAMYIILASTKPKKKDHSKIG